MKKHYPTVVKRVYQCASVSVPEDVCFSYLAGLVDKSVFRFGVYLPNEWQTFEGMLETVFFHSSID